jgi:hypothetical protein
MLDAAYTSSQLRGAMLTMLGRSEGLALLDISEDGFWKSLQAVLVALPAMALSWTATGLEVAISSHMTVVGAAACRAFIDLAGWFLPVIAFALVAKRLNLAHRFVHYFVASNWASAAVSFLALPIVLLSIFAPGAQELIGIASLAFFVLTLVLSFRMTHVALAQPFAVTLAVFLALTLLTLLIVFGLQDLFGLVYPPASSG